MATPRKQPYERKPNDLKKYGLTSVEYTAMFNSQGGKCWICQQRSFRKALAVDHCHQTGRVRGLLCSRCNYGLGVFFDAPGRLRRAAEYLERQPEPRVLIDDLEDTCRTS
jgi:hypothetical protein